MGDLEDFLGFLLGPGPVLAIVAIWGMRQQMEELSLPLSLPHRILDLQNKPSIKQKS